MFINFIKIHATTPSNQDNDTFGLKAAAKKQEEDADKRLKLGGTILVVGITIYCLSRFFKSKK